MYRITSAQVVLLLTATGYVLCGASVDYCVFSNENRLCNSICNECKLLEEYLSDNFTPSYSSFIFYPGTHNLSRPWNITGVHNITLEAMEGRKVTIKCTSENAGFQFVNVTGLTIQDIQIFHCGVDANIDGHSVKSALIFHGGKDLQLEALNVNNSYIAGMSIHDVTGRVCIKASLFTGAYSNITGTQHYAAGNFIAYKHYLEPSTVELANTLFENNVANHDKCKPGDHRLSLGLSIMLQTSNISIKLSNVTLRNNSGCTGGNMAIILFDMFKLVNSASITIGNNSRIEAGHGRVGGGMFVTMIKLHNSSDSSNTVSSIPLLPLLTIRNSTISNNSADSVGGGIYLKQLETYNFSSPGIVNITDCSFVGNYLRGSGNGGLALHFTTSVVRELCHERPQLKVFVSFCNFSDHANVDSKPKVGDAVVFVKTSPYFSLSDISIVHNKCTGLLAISSNVMVSSHVNISHNHAYKGGGMLLCSGAVVYLKKNTILWITYNNVKHTGGGIGIEMECVINNLKSWCFYQFDSEIKQNHTLLNTVQVTVKNNKAMYAGDNIYGGYVSHCYLIDFSENATDVYTQIFDTPNNTFYGLLSSSVSSSPTEVCLFNVTTKERNCTHGEIEIYPGETFNITVIIVGQHYGLVPGTVYANLMNSSMKQQHLPKSYRVQTVNSKSKAPGQLAYRVYSKKVNVTARLHLTVEEIGSNSYLKRLVISIKMKTCPLGFKLRVIRSNSRCDCEGLRALAIVHQKKGEMKCYISKRVGISYNIPLWIGLVETGSRGTPKSIAMSATCPRDYCNLTNHLFLKLTNLTVDSGVQCYFNRVGVLCGGCMNGSSLILGSSECSEHCTNYYLFLLIVFAFAGIALVFIITFLELTVTMGTINGLIFYANIIQIYMEDTRSFIPSFLRIFIAWLNLDLGFRVCFFKGMDGFSKALLQFIFPVYIWTIAGTIIILSNRYAIAMKLFGKNSVKVLATLILLSYTKIIRAVMDTLHYTLVHLPGQKHAINCWSMDGRLKYFDGKHIPVFIIGLIFATAYFPFMITLLCIQHIGLLSNWPFFSWIYKLKPFFDSYTGPFTDKGRFWIGLLLLVRVITLVLYSFNINMVVLTSTVLICFILLLIAMLFPKGVYSKHGLNVLEHFYIVNLGFLFLGLIHYGELKAYRVYIVNISIGTTFFAFLLTMIYHTLLKLKCLGSLKRFWPRWSRNYIENVNPMRCPPYHGENQDREPLLANIEH